MPVVVRMDIQALRGLAVLAVVLYHAKLGSVVSGFLGVDVFFVISGYLITGLIARGVERGTFSLKDFYIRRAKRLLPAAYFTFLVTALLAPWLLTQQEAHDFVLQLIGAVTFTANIVLWQQTGYFGGAGELKPLLHTWSLSLEEQYYLLLPVLLLMLRKSRWLWVVTAALLVSLLLCALGNEWKPIATFYLLPTRAWEMLIGSVGALLVLRFGEEIIAEAPAIKALFYPAIAALLALPMLENRGAHPGPIAAVICLATLTVILRRHRRLPEFLVTKALARVGDFSYSLYLVHWPVVSLLKNAWVGEGSELDISWRFAAVLISVAIAYPLYRCIERPLHRAVLRRHRGLLVGSICTTGLLLLVAVKSLQTPPSAMDFKDVRRPNVGFNGLCEYTGDPPFTPKVECSNSANPKVMVWGDSFAMHLVPGLAAHPELGGILQATRSTCGPIRHLAPERLINETGGPVYNRKWAERCIAFNESVFEYVRGHPTIETIVLSSRLSQYVDPSVWIQVTDAVGGLQTAPANPVRAAEALQQTVRELQALGRKVIVVGPPPRAGFDAGACMERRLTGLVSIGGENGCVVTTRAYQTERWGEIAIQEALVKGNVPLIRLDQFLCNERKCSNVVDGVMVYGDRGHLTNDASRQLAARMDWAGAILRLGR